MTPEQQTQLQGLRDLDVRIKQCKPTSMGMPYSYQKDMDEYSAKLRNHAPSLMDAFEAELAAKDVEIERLKKLLGQAPDPDPLDEENRCDECQNIACVCGDEDEEEDTWGLEYTDTL